jgi:hypothetical protein
MSKRTVIRALLAVMMAAASGGAMAQAGGPAPGAGYVFPAGGRQGDTVDVTVGGQFLRGAQTVHVTGTGAEARVERFVGPMIIRGMTAQLLAAQLREAWQERTGMVLPGKKAGTKDFEGVNLPDHPQFQDLGEKSTRELAWILSQLRGGSRRQLNTQLATGLILRVTIAPDAEPGVRELRIVTPGGITNPLRFEVGTLPEAVEEELNDPALELPVALPPIEPVQPPVVVNGQIMPGDVDRIPFHAAKGGSLHVAVRARSLVPYMADAVPGWFQAVAAIYDANGVEVAYDDDFGHDPDPALVFTPPQDGVYELEVRDAIYRGREDFVYRAVLAPAGTQDLVAPVFRPAVAGDLPVISETEPNDSLGQAQRVDLPVLVSGRIDRPGDTDFLTFSGAKDEEMVVEVWGRRGGSPVDSCVRLWDPSGRLLALNDDAVGKEGHLFTGPGLLTHHADSLLRVRLEGDGMHGVEILDVQGQGGKDLEYQVRISRPQPDFGIRVSPSGVRVDPGRHAPMRVYIDRRDGFDGPVEVALKDAPPGFALQGATVPPGCNHTDITLSAPARPLTLPVTLQLEGRANVNGGQVARAAEPCDDQMQAFLWRHLVPARALVVAVEGNPQRGRPIALLQDVPVRIPEGAGQRVVVQAPANPRLGELILELSDPPQGLAISDFGTVPRGLAFTLCHTGDGPPAGFRGNAVISLHFMQQQEGRPDGQARRVNVGYLPAIPYEIVPGDPA